MFSISWQEARFWVLYSVVFVERKKNKYIGVSMLINAKKGEPPTTLKGMEHNGTKSIKWLRLCMTLNSKYLKLIHG